MKYQRNIMITKMLQIGADLFTSSEIEALQIGQFDLTFVHPSMQIGWKACLEEHLNLIMSLPILKS